MPNYDAPVGISFTFSIYTRICDRGYLTRPAYNFRSAYRTEEGKPWVLPVVRTIEAQMSSDATLNKEYLPLLGMKAFTEACTKLLLGESSLAITQNRVGTWLYIPSYKAICTKYIASIVLTFLHCVLRLSVFGLLSSMEWSFS